jgi:hypothetical protein
MTASDIHEISYSHDIIHRKLHVRRRGRVLQPGLQTSQTNETQTDPEEWQQERRVQYDPLVRL